MEQPKDLTTTNFIASQNTASDAAAPPPQDQFNTDSPYVPLPEDPRKRTFDAVNQRPWRIVIAPVGLTARWMAYEMYGDLIMGSTAEGSRMADIDLSVYDGRKRGVSRRHVMLRPGQSKLYIMDLRSTNGTQINGQPLEVGWAYSLQDNDLVSMGKLHIRMRLTQRPTANR